MKHELPPLPYDYNALEPYYDEQTVRIHHDKHHATYVTGLNKAEEELAKAREAGDYSLIQHWERQLAFHGSGHILHTLFWESMSPQGGGEPKGGLLEQINRDFGSFENFKKQFSAAAAQVEANGWALLGYYPAFNKLYIMQVENHQKLTMWGIRPLLVLDVWEHAYYLKFQNRRADWIENWWNIVNWDNAAKEFSSAKVGISVPEVQ